MKTVYLDLTGCRYWDDLHERIRVAFGFPEWYGANWDAFWDLIRSECDADKVIITGEHTMSKEFDRHLAMMHEVMDDEIKFRNRLGLPPFAYEIRS